MFDYIDKLIEALTNCLTRISCNCHTHCCSCFDISVDVIRKQNTALTRQFTTYFERE